MYVIYMDALGVRLQGASRSCATKINGSWATFKNCCQEIVRGLTARDWATRGSWFSVAWHSWFARKRPQPKSPKNVVEGGIPPKLPKKFKANFSNLPANWCVLDWVVLNDDEQMIHSIWMYIVWTQQDVQTSRLHRTSWGISSRTWVYFRKRGSEKKSRVTFS